MFEYHLIIYRKYPQQSVNFLNECDLFIDHDIILLGILCEVNDKIDGAIEDNQQVGEY